MELTDFFSPTGNERAASELVYRKMLSIGLRANLQEISATWANALAELSGSGGGLSLMFQLATSIGLARPIDKSSYRYLSEYHAFGRMDEEAGNYSEDLAAAMLASTLGVEFDEDESWGNKRQLWKICGNMVGSRNITQSAIVDKHGK
jgi:hypothetical protein